MSEKAKTVTAYVIAGIFIVLGAVFILCKVTGYDPIIVP